MIGKVIGSAISLILVVGVVVGVVVSVHNKDGSSSTDSLSPQMKAVTQFCQPTNYKEACTQTLSNANTTDPKELIQAGVLAISAALSKAFNTTDDLVIKAQAEPRGKMALDDCKDLLQQAQQELQATMTKIGDSDIRSLADRSDDFRTWLSSVIAYQEMCVDGFEDNSQVKLAMVNNTNLGNQLTDNVLTILGGLSDVLKKLGLALNVNPTSRRLLEEDGYPSWMSAADRKLLASRSLAGVTPNAVVAQDGSGRFRTVQAAVNACPKNHNGRWVIYVKAGVYREQVHITKAQPRIYMYGDGPRRTIITGDKSYSKGVGTWMTATVIVESDGFIAKSIGFSNTAGPDGHQALALRVNSDMSSFYNVRLDGYQDTLCYQSQRQFYRNCVLSGTVDFLFGYGAAVIQNSLIILRKPNPNQFNTVTADGRKEKGMPTGLVIHNCRIVPEQKLVPQKFQIKSYLGRPWKDYSRTVIMESTLGDVIQPEGWTPWSGNMFLNTLYYAEFGNAGPGANAARRVKWSRQITKNEATQFTVANFIQGNQWIASTGAPALLGFKRH